MATFENERQPSIPSDAEDEDSMTVENAPDSVIRKDLFSNMNDLKTPKKLVRESVDHTREHMQVFLRVRPFTKFEKMAGEDQGCMEIEGQSNLIMRAPKDSFMFKNNQRGQGDMSHRFTFSHISDPEMSQKSFFDNTMLSTVKDTVDGHNCLIFTYGITNAGKTYTIQGTPQDGGILPRSLDVIFNSIEGKQYLQMKLKPEKFCDVIKLSEAEQIRERQIKNNILNCTHNQKQDKDSGHAATDGDSDISKSSVTSTISEDSLMTSSSQEGSKEDGFSSILDQLHSRIPDDTSVSVDTQGPVKFSVWASFAEIYNEQIYDLLEPMPRGKKPKREILRLHEDKNSNIYIKGLKDINIQSADEAFKLLSIGQRNLQIASTRLNHNSSRSHCIFSVKILRVVDVDDPHVARVSKLSFCDLAGSERYAKTLNSGDRLKESGNINTSLMTLGKCISLLRYNQNHHKAQQKLIPFRESKLTRLFQNFFLGKGKASMIVNVNQCSSVFDETMHVLKFSAIAKQVTTRTSRLENRWQEELAASRMAQARKVSIIIDQACKRASGAAKAPRLSRSTVGWLGTPRESLAGAVTEETIMEEEEEEEEEVDQTVIIDEDLISSHPVVLELKDLVEALQQQLVEEKRNATLLEMKIREEVCNEMAQQLVEIETNYSERLREEHLMAEEKFEKRLEIYAQSVKKSRKRALAERDEAQDEYISTSLLHAEQAKIQEKEAEIDQLNLLVSSLKSDLSELKEQNDLTSVANLDPENNDVIEKLKEQVIVAKETIATKTHQVDELEETLKEAAETFSEKNKEIDDLKQTIAQYELKTPSQQKLDSELEEAQKLAEEAKQSLSLAEKKLQERDNVINELKAASDQHRQGSLVSKPRPSHDSTALFEMDEMRIKVEHLEDQLKRALEEGREVQKLTKMTEDQSSQLRSAAEEIEALQAKLKLSQEEQNWVSALCQDKEERKGELEKAHAEAQRQLAESKEEVFRMGSLIEDHRRNEEKFKEQVRELEVSASNKSEHALKTEDLYKQLKTGFDEQEKALGVASQENASLVARLAELEEAVKSRECDLAERNQLHAALVLESDRLRDQVSHLEQDLQQKTSDEDGQVSAWQQTKADLQKAQESLESQRTRQRQLEDTVLRQEETAKSQKISLVAQKELFARENAKFQEKVEDLENSLRQANEEKQALEAEKDTTESTMTKEKQTHSEEKASCEAQMANLKKDLETALTKQAEKYVDDMANQEAAWKVKLASSNEELDKLKGDLACSREQLSAAENRLNADLKKATDGEAEARKELKKITTLLHERGATIKELEEKNISQGDELSRVIAQKTELVQAAEAHAHGKKVEDSEVQSLRDKIDNLEETIKTKSATFRRIMSKVEEQKEKLAVAETDVNNNEKVIEKLRAALEEQETTMSQQDSVLGQKDGEISRLQKDFAHVNAEVATLRTNLEQKERELEEISGEKEASVAKLQARSKVAEEAEEELSREREEMATQLKEVQEKERQLAETFNQKNEVASELEKVREENRRLEVSLKQFQEDKKLLAESLDQKNEKMALELEAVREKNRELKEARKSRDRNLEKELKKKEKAITKMEEELKEKENTISKMEEEMEKKGPAVGGMGEARESQDRDPQVAKLEKELKKKEKIISDLTSQPAGRTRSTRSRTSKNQPEEQQLISEIDMLRKQFSTEQKAKDMIIDEYKSTNFQLQDTYSKTSSELHEQLEKYKKANNELQTQNKKLQDQFQQKESELDEERTRAVTAAPSQHPPPPPAVANQMAASGEAPDSEPEVIVIGPAMRRVQIDATPLQSKPHHRSLKRSRTKSRNPDSENKKPKSNIEDGSNCETEEEGPKSSKRPALVRFGDYFSNSPMGRSAKKLLEATGLADVAEEKEPCQSLAPLPSEKKRKRKLYKTDISAPFECPPFQDVNEEVNTRRLRTRTVRN